MFFHSGRAAAARTLLESVEDIPVNVVAICNKGQAGKISSFGVRGCATAGTRRQLAHRAQQPAAHTDPGD